jgi:hypothetical protein
LKHRSKMFWVMNISIMAGSCCRRSQQ